MAKTKTQYRKDGRIERINSQILSVHETAELTLKLIRSEGVDAVSIRRLADELRVTSAALYYHFKNKDDILAMAARVAIEEVRGAGDPDRPWRDWILENVCAYRKVLLKYPELVPTMLHRHLLNIGTDEQATQLLRAQGAPDHIILPLFEALESFTAGHVLYTTSGTEEDRPTELSHRFPDLVRARHDAGLTSDEVFVRTARAIIDTLGGSS